MSFLSFIYSQNIVFLFFVVCVGSFFFFGFFKKIFFIFIGFVFFFFVFFLKKRRKMFICNIFFTLCDEIYHYNIITTHERDATMNNSL
ncbi:UNVERIFIED_CONTAM: hypothetical protein DVV43_11430 [Lactobacillus helveticus]|nr:hypothetical protein [Lactobacillus helveticus]